MLISNIFNSKPFITTYLYISDNADPGSSCGCLLKKYCFVLKFITFSAFNLL